MLYRDSDDILFVIEFQDVEMNTDEYIALGQVYHHSETVEFIQQMEETSRISEKANMKIKHVKSSIILIVLALLVIGALLMAGICFAGRTCASGCLKRNHWKNNSPYQM